MKRIGLVVGLLLCVLYGERADAKKREPTTRSEALADCQSDEFKTRHAKYFSGPQGPKLGLDDARLRCPDLIALAEQDFLSGDWHPSDGPFRKVVTVNFVVKGRTVSRIDRYDCRRHLGGKQNTWRVLYKPQCSYLDNIDKDPDFASVVQATEEAERRSVATQREETQRRERCDKVWSAYVEPVKQGFDSSLERQLYNLPEAAVVPAWALERVFNERAADAVNMLKKPASADEQLGTYFDLAYYLVLARSEKFPAACSDYKFDPGYDEQTGKALEARLSELTAQVDARAEEIEREKKLDDAYSRKLFAAIRRAGAKGDVWYRGLGEAMVEYGMKKMRGRAVLLDWEDESFGLIQILPGGRALFSGGFPFNVMVVGIKTADLMHGTALTDIGLHWVKVLGLVNYTNPVGGQAQAVKVKPLRNIPHPERGEKLK